MRAWLALLAALLAAAAAAKSIGVPETGPMSLNATHTGYLPLDDDEGGAAMFYAYWESEAGAGPSHPITVWLQVRITDRRRSDTPGELACGGGRPPPPPPAQGRTAGPNHRGAPLCHAL